MAQVRFQNLDQVLTEEFLRQHYLVLKKPSNLIAAEIGCSPRAVRNHLKRRGFEGAMRERRQTVAVGRRPTYRFEVGHTPWNKGKEIGPSWNTGLTKETSPSVARVAASKRGRKRPELTGERHPRWKGGTSGEAHRIRKSIEYGTWRDAVFRRDDFTCQNCEARGGKLEAHHIRPFCLYPESRFDVSNGLTLCFTCHRALPHAETKRKKSRAQ